MKNPGVMFIGVGFELFALVIGGMYFGKAVDDYYKLNGLGEKIVLGAVLLSWCFHFYILIRRYMKSIEEEESINDKKTK